MPRLPWKILWHAQSIDPLLPLLLRQCRTIPSAANELRWLRDHVQSSSHQTSADERLRKLCRDRSRGNPLQYILGDQPFGDLSILCQRHVLIPRSVLSLLSRRPTNLVLPIIGLRPKHGPPILRRASSTTILSSSRRLPMTLYAFSIFAQAQAA